MRFQGCGGSSSIARGEKQNTLEGQGVAKMAAGIYFPAGRKRPKRVQLGM